MKTKIQKITNEKDLNYYLNLAYAVKIDPDSEGGYVAQIEDLPGCFTQGDTLEEVADNINEARELWIETAYSSGDPIPLPSSKAEYSGKVLLRMPKSLHRDLVRQAKNEDVSLNQYIISLLSRSSRSETPLHPCSRAFFSSLPTLSPSEKAILLLADNVIR